MTKKLKLWAVAVAMMAVLAGCGTTENIGESSDSRIPPEVATKEGYYSKPIPPNGFTHAVGMMAAIHDFRKPGTSQIKIDFIRLHATVNGQDMVIREDHFDSVDYNAMQWYGLYQRSPWFAGDRLEAMPWSISGSCLVINPSDRPDRIFHFWNTSRAQVPAGATRVWMEAMVLITGPALIQGGEDYWINGTAGYAGYNVNNTEAGLSRWHFASPDWQLVTVGKP